MTDEELKAIEALVEATTPGPWREDDCNIICGPLADARMAAVMAKIEGRPYDKEHIRFDAFVATTQQRHEESDADARFIAAARTAVPALIAALRAERRRAKVAEAQWDYWSSRDIIGSRAKDDEGRRALLRLNDLGVEPVEHSPGWKR